MPPHAADGETSFSDDDLDDLPIDALAELEHNAIQLTQTAYANLQPPAPPSAKSSHTAAPSSDYGDFDDEDLDDAVVIDESRSTPAVLPSLAQHVPGLLSRQQVPVSQQRASQTRSSASLNNRSKSALPISQPRASQQRGSTASLNNPSRPAVPQFQPSTQTATQSFLQQGVPAKASQSSQPVPALDHHVELLRQLEEARQPDALQQKNNLLQQNLNAKAGEVAIVRSKQQKESKEHERELAALRKITDDKLSKQKKELELARAAAINAATERDFIKLDLAESARVGRLRAVERKDSNTTPKKKKSLPHRDGFDDDEMEIPSPSKLSPSKSRSRLGTPSKIGKRKRKANDSPITALDVQVDAAIEEPVQSKLSIIDETIIAKLGIQDDRFDFIGTMLDHRPSKDHLRTIEALGKHSLPSSNEESFAAVILGKIPSFGAGKQIENLPVEFCELLISIWARCVQEKYLRALYLLIDWLAFALELKTTAIAPHIIDSLLPLLQTTVDIVVIPRFYRRPLEGSDEFIDVTSYLNVLHITALGCMSDLEHITRFWRVMRLDFVLLCLSQNQPTEHFHKMLKILSTSVLPQTFGNIDPGKETLNAGYVIDRLTYPLFQVPFQPTVDIRLDSDVLLPLRLGCLQLLTSMTRSPFASAALAQHQTALGRLVCLISDTLDNLYDWRACHESSGLIITLGTRLLYHLVTKHPNINMQQKLTQIHGGSQKYLLVLARLNFSEDDLVLEKGIAPDVQGLALEMLESVVTPEEGDKIYEAFLGS